MLLTVSYQQNTERPNFIDECVQSTKSEAFIVDDMTGLSAEFR
jgi:hypothetical protein